MIKFCKRNLGLTFDFMVVKEIIIYPIKSLGGINTDRAIANEKGLEHDRRMMLVDSNGRFLSQRERHEMALIGAEFAENGFKFYNKQNPEDSIIIPNDPDLEKELNVTVWDDQFSAMALSNNYNNWFKNMLNIDAQLVKMNDLSLRYKSIKTKKKKTLVSLADGYPYLFISQSSLNDLNSRLEVDIPMNRFRPNIVFDQCESYDEELLETFQINNCKFEMIKPCARCVITTINQKTGEKLVEPLKTLSNYKRVGNKIFFGMNAICLDKGKIEIGDEIIPII